MALYGYNVPNMKNPADMARRAEIFSIIAQYCFSDKDLEYIDKVPENIRDLWYISFASSQNVMVRSKLLHSTRSISAGIFLKKALLPKPNMAKR